MEYKEIKQTSQQIEKVEQFVKTELSLQGLYKLAEIKRVEIPNAFQLMIILKIPKLLN